MTAANGAAVTVFLLDAYVGTQYCLQLIRRQTRPRMATWLIFEIGVVMSLVAYFTSHDHSVAKAVLNVTDAAVVTAILAALLIQQRGRKISFTANERLCLAISLLTLAAWAITKTAWIGVAGFQLVMTIAYMPTIESLWQRTPGRSPEPLETWAINAVAALLGVVLDITGAHHDYLAMLYPLRAFVLCVVVAALILRWRRVRSSAQVSDA